MSFQVYDVNGYISDFATVLGAADYFDWLSTKDNQIISDFVAEGYALVPAALMEEIEKYDPPKGDIKSIHDNFMTALDKCEEIVVVSDGLNDDLEDEERLVEERSNE